MRTTFLHWTQTDFRLVGRHALIAPQQDAVSCEPDTAGVSVLLAPPSQLTRLARRDSGSRWLSRHLPCYPACGHCPLTWAQVALREGRGQKGTTQSPLGLGVRPSPRRGDSSPGSTKLERWWVDTQQVPPPPAFLSLLCSLKAWNSRRKPDWWDPVSRAAWRCSTERTFAGLGGEHSFLCWQTVLALQSRCQAPQVPAPVQNCLVGHS